MRNKQSGENTIAKGFRDTPHDQRKQENSKLGYDQVPIPCCRIDNNLIIHDCNDLLADLLGEPKHNLNQVSFGDFIERASYPLVEEILAFPAADFSSGVRTKTVWLKRNGGDKAAFPCSLSLKPITDIQGKQIGHVILIIDETQNRRTIERLEKDRYELKEKEATKDEFIAVASHELKTPIQPILGYALLAKKGLMGQDEAWDGVLEEARKLQQIANDILDVSRIEAGTMAYVMKKEKINGLLTSITESAKRNLQKDGPSLVVAYDQDQADLEIDIDRLRIIQLINNILDNAIKFTGKGMIRIESKAFPEQNKFELSIRDSGKGISEEVMPKLFEKFMTKGHGNVENHKGTGLGLYICRAIVRAHGGKISAFNNKDGGATFLIVLPISQKP
jgi:signal transduction histidine kinase